MRCPFYSDSSAKYLRMRCRHYHSGREWIAFTDRDQLRAWKASRCDGDPPACPYFTENVGRDIEFEDVWVAIVTVGGRDYWCRVPAGERYLDAAVQYIIRNVRLFSVDEDTVVAVDFTIKVKAVHSTDPEFSALLDDLHFSGKRFEDWIA